MMNNNACFVHHVSCHDLLPLLMLAFPLYILPLWYRNGSCLSPCRHTNIGHESNWGDAGPVFRWLTSEALSACFDENPNSVPPLVGKNFLLSWCTLLCTSLVMGPFKHVMGCSEFCIYLLTSFLHVWTCFHFLQIYPCQRTSIIVGILVHERELAL
jgi:hypothetical protein